MRLKIVLCLMLMSYSSSSFGQQAAEPGREYGLEFCELLPSQIDGITDIVPFWGMRYGYHLGAGMAEAALDLANAQGTSYDMLQVGYRFDVPVDDKLNGFLNGGINNSYFNTYLRSEKIWISGLFVGGGAMTQLVGNIWGRLGMQFNFIPGASMFITVGIEYRDFGGGGG